jgi:REP element-mobilizing transposase RayT
MSTDKFQNKYRIPSNRAQWWNYSNNAAYFITICTANKIHFFGEILEGKIQLSEIGKIVETEWLKTIDLRPDMNLTLGEYVIMPNHFHCIIVIGKNKYNTQKSTVIETQCIASNISSTCNIVPAVETQCIASNITSTCNIIPAVEMQCIASLRQQQPNKFGPQSKNLASIIRGFKIGVTTNARKINAVFTWQTRFYDHIIRDAEEYQRIADYIVNNPVNWQNDKFYNN